MYKEVEELLKEGKTMGGQNLCKIQVSKATCRMLELWEEMTPQERLLGIEEDKAR